MEKTGRGRGTGARAVPFLRLTEGRNMGNGKKWVSVWGNAMSVTERTAAGYGKDITFRYPVPVAFDGDAVRLTFDNFCGTEDAELSCVYVAQGVGDEQTQGATACAVTFGGEQGTVIPAGGAVVSDPVPAELRRGTLLTVSFYFAGYVELRSGVDASGPLSRGSFAFGNHVKSEHLPIERTRSTDTYYFLSDVSVHTAEGNAAIICYGDSVTARSWPDYLTLELAKGGISGRSVVRKAASGSRILRQYGCAAYESYGLKGSVRFPHEIDAVDGARYVIILHGINDIIHPVGTTENPFRPWSDLPVRTELTGGLISYIDMAHERGLKVFLGTLLPIEGWRTYEPFREQLRAGVNEFIRETPLADGLIDFDKVVRDPLRPTRLSKACDSGDCLHPSEEGHRAMAREAARVLRDYERFRG